MADHNDDELPPPAPVFPPKPPREPVVIDGEAHELPEAAYEAEAPHEAPAGSEPEPAMSEPAAETVAAEIGATSEAEPEPALADAPLPPPPAPRRLAAFGFGLGGAFVGAGAVLAASWLYDPHAGALNELAVRTEAAQSAVTSEAQSRKALEGRLAALEAVAGAAVKGSDIKALDQRVEKLEAAPSVTPAALAAVQAEARAARETASKALAAGLAAGAPAATGASDAGAADPRVARQASALAALEDRVGRLEAASPPSKGEAAPASPSTPDPRVARLESAQAGSQQALTNLQASIDARLGKLEAAIAAPKAETRVAPDAAAPRPDAAAQGIAALALEQQLATGQPFTTEWAALSRLGADANALAALKPFADAGAPSASALGAAFAKIEPSALAAAEPAAKGGILDKLAAEAGKMVKVHPVGEVAGDDPQALATQIQSALARGQVEAAFGLWKKWPEAARKASADWGRSLEGRAGADAAARTLREGALARLAPTKN